MPTRALSMRKIRELIRLKYEARPLARADCRGAGDLQGGGGQVRCAHRARGAGARQLMGDVGCRGDGAHCAGAAAGQLRRPDRAGFCPCACRAQAPERDADAAVAGIQRAPMPTARTYRYSQFTDLYRDYVATLRRSMRQVHRAGEKLFVDYAGQTVPYGREGDRAQIFVAALGASHYTFACATAHQRLIDWTGALVRALEFIDGVPALIVPDNARALIADPDRYEPRASATIEDLARHYGTAVLPARPYRPQDKAKVEVAVQIVQRWILARLRNRVFATLADVDGAVGDLLTDLNTRAFKRLPGSRVSAYEQLDRPALKALPVSRYEFARYYEARVNIDYHIAIEDHFYSVPQALVHQKVEVRATARSVEILYRAARVASHARSFTRFADTTLPEHLPAAHRAHLEWSPGRLIRWGEQPGAACAEVIRHILASRPHPEQGYRACLGLLRLERQHGAAAPGGGLRPSAATGQRPLSNRRLDPEAANRESSGE